MSKAILKITSGCNNNCIFCHTFPKKAYTDPSIEEIESKIDSANSLDIDTILLSGGEPTIRKDFQEIINLIISKGLKFGLNTNARMLSYDHISKFMLSKGLVFAHLSLHGKKEMHDNLTRDKGSFDQTMKAISNLDKKCYILVNCVVNSVNVDSLKEVVDLVKDFSLKLKFTFVEPIDNKQIIPDIKYASENVKKAIDYAKSNGLEAYLDCFPLCLVVDYEDRISNLKTEGIEYMSEIYDTHFHEVDVGNKEKMSFCEDCQSLNQCEGVYKRYLEMFGEHTLKDIAEDYKKKSKVK